MKGKNWLNVLCKSAPFVENITTCGQNETLGNRYRFTHSLQPIYLQNSIYPKIINLQNAFIFDLFSFFPGVRYTFKGSIQFLNINCLCVNLTTKCRQFGQQIFHSAIQYSKQYKHIVLQYIIQTVFLIHFFNYLMSHDTIFVIFRETSNQF